MKTETRGERGREMGWRWPRGVTIFLLQCFDLGGNKGGKKAKHGRGRVEEMGE
jgi:hypothetical protein